MKPPPTLLTRPSGSPTPKDDYVSREFTFAPTERPGEYIAIKASGERKLFRSASRSEAYTAAAKWTLLKTQPASQAKAPDAWVDPDFVIEPWEE